MRYNKLHDTHCCREAMGRHQQNKNMSSTYQMSPSIDTLCPELSPACPTLRLNVSKNVSLNVPTDVPMSHKMSQCPNLTSHLMSHSKCRGTTFWGGKKKTLKLIRTKIGRGHRYLALSAFRTGCTR